MSTATLSTKGQLVIPHRFRKALHLEPGDQISLTLEGEKLVLQRDQPRRAQLVRLAVNHGLKLATLDGALCRKAWAAGTAENPL